LLNPAHRANLGASFEAAVSWTAAVVVVRPKKLRMLADYAAMHSINKR
jgi:hypothetical protein